MLQKVTPIKHCILYMLPKLLCLFQKFSIVLKDIFFSQSHCLLLALFIYPIFIDPIIFKYMNFKMQFIRQQ